MGWAGLRTRYYYYYNFDDKRPWIPESCFLFCMVIDQSAPLQPAYLTRPTTGQPAKCFYTRPPEGHLCWSSLRGRRECTLYTPVEPPLPPTRKLAKGPKLSLMPSNFSHTYKRCHAKMPPPNPTSHFNLPHFHGIKSQKPQLSWERPVVTCVTKMPASRHWPPPYLFSPGPSLLELHVTPGDYSAVVSMPEQNYYILYSIIRR